MTDLSRTTELSPQEHRRAVDKCGEIVALADHLVGHSPIHDIRCVAYAEVISRLASDVRGALLGVVFSVLLVVMAAGSSGCAAASSFRDWTNNNVHKPTPEEIERDRKAAEAEAAMNRQVAECRAFVDDLKASAADPAKGLACDRFLAETARYREAQRVAFERQQRADLQAQQQAQEDAAARAEAWRAAAGAFAGSMQQSQPVTTQTDCTRDYFGNVHCTSVSR